MEQQWLPVGLLGASLLLLWVSTRQFHLGLRCLIWLAGAVALGAAVWIGLRDPDIRSLAELRAIWSSGSSGGEIAGAFSANWSIVGETVPPMLAIFVLLSVVLALAALIAFTPGETIERLTRPLITALLGAMAGAFIALVFVALGFGGYLKPRNYVFRTGDVAVIDGELTLGDNVRVVDGDTLRVGDVSLRLEGIDAPEHDQTCVGSTPNCGEEAARHLAEMLRQSTVICSRSDENPETPPPESFGRPIVECRVLSEDDPVDVGPQMISDGFAVEYLDRDDPIPTRVTTENGLCTVHPRAWRRGNRDVEDACAGASVAAPSP
jgi:endonuclease YncB( thermonuclease family)